MGNTENMGSNLQHTMVPETVPKRRLNRQQRSMDVKRICLVFCKYAERFEAEEAAIEQRIDSPMTAAGSAVQSSVPTSVHW